VRFATDLGAHELGTGEDAASKFKKFAAQCKRLITEGAEGRMRLFWVEGEG